MKTVVISNNAFIIIIIFLLSISFESCKKDIGESTSLHSKIDQPQISSSTINSCNTSTRIYLDLTKDQVTAGGVTEAMLQKYLNEGYVKGSLTEDKFAKHVRFKDSKGNFYYKDGYLPKGTTYLINKRTDKFYPPVLRSCNNDFWELHDIYCG